MKNPIDLVLLDYEMPVMSGAQVLEVLREEPSTSDIPVVFLTGVGTKEAVLNVRALRPKGYILKSTTQNELLAWLEKFFKD